MTRPFSTPPSDPSSGPPAGWDQGQAAHYGQPAPRHATQPGAQPAAQPVLPGYAGQPRAAATPAAYAQSQAQTQAQAQAQAATATAVRPDAAAEAGYNFRKGATPAEPPPPAVVTRPGHPRRVRTGLGAIGLGQLVAWQLAAVAVLMAWNASDLVVTVIVAVVALLLVSPTLVRFRGRWLYRWLTVWLRFRGRPHKSPVTGAGAALDLLSFAEPTVALDAAELDDQQIALLSHRGGLCAVLELGPDDSALFAGEPVRLPSPVTMLPAADAHAFPITAQLLISVAPAPVVGPGVVERSYRELTGGEVPAQRRSWLVLQATRTADAYTDAELRPDLLSAVKRARRHLRTDKVAARVLDRDGLLGAVQHLARLTDTGRAGPRAGGRNAPAPDAAHRPTGRETWRAAWVDDLVHSSRRVTHWPVRAWQPEELLRRLPAVGSVLAVAVTHNPARVAEDEQVLVELAFRLTAPDPAVLGAGDKALDDAVRAAGGRTERYDGEQVPGLAATLPLGGFLS